MNKTLLIIFIFIFSLSTFADVKGDPFSPEVQNEITEKVAAILKVKLKDEIPLFRVENTKTTNCAEIIAFEKQYDLNIRGTATNWFLPPSLILLGGTQMKIHNLAHEIAHYIQYHYMGYNTPEDAYSDEAEDMAIYVQNHFRD